MEKDNKIEMPIPTFDDLFKSTKPEEVVREKVVTLKTKDIVPFPNHPFKVKDLEMEEMVESIRNIGVNVPITVRKSENGEYQIQLSEGSFQIYNEVPKKVRGHLNGYEKR